ncbi:carboxymuconolactone decarboxylase family protein [Flexibacterium corallicola]|uniref:carboxymuconolactone decarboxylase family protein n=1 Tax=Flexibacterium corallicola TaxID=3037259 RepID=UPI00286F666B|nr:carboxymuconolactone decarboxylase family protein [Pseudovibrio sp. M1P-2-3]
MSDFKTYTPENAPEASKPLLEKTKKAFGFIPNLYGTMAESPAILEGYMSLAGIFGKTSLSETERQIIMMTNNRLNGCEYCMAAHSTVSQMKNVPADVIEALRNGTELADPKLEALRKFSEVINETRGWPSEEQVDALLEAGYTRQTVLEVVLGTSLKVMSNYTNHIAHTEVDAPFKANAWSAK